MDLDQKGPKHVRSAKDVPFVDLIQVWHPLWVKRHQNPSKRAEISTSQPVRRKNLFAINEKL